MLCHRARGVCSPNRNPKNSKCHAERCARKRKRCRNADAVCARDNAMPSQCRCNAAAMPSQCRNDVAVLFECCRSSPHSAIAPNALPSLLRPLETLLSLSLPPFPLRPTLNPIPGGGPRFLLSSPTTITSGLLVALQLIPCPRSSPSSPKLSAEKSRASKSSSEIWLPKPLSAPHVEVELEVEDERVGEAQSTMRTLREARFGQLG